MIEFPGGGQSQAWGINADGKIAGFYSSSGSLRGFLLTAGP